jgi:hypothetical protein
MENVFVWKVFMIMNKIFQIVLDVIINVKVVLILINVMFVRDFKEINLMEDSVIAMKDILMKVC